MAFDEVRISEKIAYGAQGGPEFSNVVVATGSGSEQVVVQWELPLRRWEIAYNDRNRTQGDELLAFFLAREGRARKFRFKDWADYSSKVADVETKHTLRELTATTFQLVKVYTSGALSHSRDIVKPVGDTLTDTAATQANSTVKIWNGSTEVTSGWTVDLTTGIVTFISDPAYAPKATFEFDTPVRFDTDRMEMVQEAVTIRSWRLPIVEVRDVS